MLHAEINLENVDSQVKPLQNILEKTIELPSVTDTVTNDSNTINKLTTSRKTKLVEEHINMETDVSILSEFPSVTEIENVVCHIILKHHSFPNCVFQQKLKNCESTLGD